MIIQIVRDNAISSVEASFYTVIADGVTLLECLSEREMEGLTLREIERLYMDKEADK